MSFRLDWPSQAAMIKEVMEGNWSNSQFEPILIWWGDRQCKNSQRLAPPPEESRFARFRPNNASRRQESSSSESWRGRCSAGAPDGWRKGVEVPEAEAEEGCEGLEEVGGL